MQKDSYFCLKNAMLNIKQNNAYTVINIGVIRSGSKWNQNDSCTSDETNWQSNQQWLLNSKDDSKLEERQVSTNHKSEKDCKTYRGIVYCTFE